MLDICYKCDKDKKIEYIWFDTGLEYQATKDHLKFLEEKYGIEIKRIKAIKPIHITCKQYGQPFLSKQVSDFIGRLQKHNFQWEDESFDILYRKYPHCKSALQWWCCKNQSNRFNITNNKWLKEFIIENHPWFPISSKCCKYAEKDVAKKAIEESNGDLSITGIRKSEGGIRSSRYKSCFDDVCGQVANYRPLFWYLDKDRKEYEDYYGIAHSDCYTKYGLKRTGCVGCPYNRKLKDELDVVKKYEPKLYKAICNIFADSYKYTQMYREFCRVKNAEQQI